MLLAGASRVVITPPLETPIGAFGEWDPRHFTGIAADIYARALVLQAEGGPPMAILSVEATEVSEPVVRRIRTEVERRTGIPAGNVLAAMTHNHCGPNLLRTAAPYVQITQQKIADAVVLAHQRLRPARLGWSVREIPGPATNRRIRLKNGRVWPRFFMGPEIPSRETAARVFSPTFYAPNVDYRSVPAAEEIIGPGPVNRQLFVMNLVDQQQGAPIAVLAHYACHASVALESRSVHGDFPGFACSRVEEVAGGICLFLAGASANINCNAFLRDRTDAEARRIGLEFSEQVLAALAAAAPRDEKPQVTARSATAWLPLRDEMRPDRNRQLRDARAGDSAGESAGQSASESAGQSAGHSAGHSDDEQFKEAARVAQEIGLLQGLETDGVLPPVTRMGGIEIGISVARVGSCIFVTIPGELFVETALRICQASPWPQTLVVTHCNGSIGYIPEPGAFGQGGYEDAPSYCSFVGPQSEERILRACEPLLAL